MNGEKMKIMFIYILLVIAVCSVQAQQFKGGTVKYIAKSEGETIRLNLFINGSNQKLDQTNSKGQTGKSFLFGAGIGVVLYPPEQIYTEYSDLKDTLINRKPPLFGNKEDEVKFIKTEKRKNILGLECREWIIKNQFSTVELWVNSNLLVDYRIIEAMPEYTIDWKKYVIEEKAFPVAINIKDENGETVYSFEAVEFSNALPDISLFAIPQEYTKSKN